MRWKPDWHIIQSLDQAESTDPLKPRSWFQKSVSATPVAQRQVLQETDGEATILDVGNAPHAPQGSSHDKRGLSYPQMDLYLCD